MSKNAIRTLCGLSLLTAALYAPFALAEDAQPNPPDQPSQGMTTTISTIASSGIVSRFSPDAIAIKTTASPTPITYQATETTTYVDEAGNSVDKDTVKPGVPVSIYYSTSGSRMVATKVVVKRATPTQPRG